MWRAMNRNNVVNLVALVTSAFILCGCCSPPKTAHHKPTTNLSYWEFKYLDGVGAEKSPEAEQLKKDGWVFVGFQQGNDSIAVGGEAESAPRSNRYNEHMTTTQAVFKRPYGLAAVSTETK